MSDTKLDVRIDQGELNNLENSNVDIYKESFDSKKRVRFPEDHSIVSDYFEAKEYWRHVRSCTSDELLLAYKISCERYSIKPIPILLEQIKGIDVKVCQERYDMLNLSNVKLDIKHVECLEEIFKRVQFKMLNFESCNLDDDSASSLFEIVEYYESCMKLNISYNPKISYSGFNSCSKMLKKSSCIDTLELKGIMFTDTTVPPLNRALRCGAHLRVLHLEFSNICSKNLIILAAALKLNQFLKELHLSGNRMVPSDGIQLGSLLKVNKFLELLDVRNNSLGDVGLGHICDGLSGQFQAMNSKTSTGSADSSNATLAAGATNPPLQGRGLLCLILWGNSISANGMPALSEALKACRSLQSLNLGNNPLSSEGVHALRDGLLVNRSLIRLSMPCCRISCEGGVAIAEYLADTRQLMRLDLRENDIKTAGLMAISLSMRVNHSITRLDIDSNSKRDGSVKGYAESQQESLKLIHERVAENKKLVIAQQEMEITQSVQRLSMSAADNSQKPIPNPDSEGQLNVVPSLADSPASIDDAVEDIDSVNTTTTGESHAELLGVNSTTGSSDSPASSPNNDAVISDDQGVSGVVMNLDLSDKTVDQGAEEDSSIGFLASKVLSPTDTRLEKQLELECADIVFDLAAAAVDYAQKNGVSGEKKQTDEPKNNGSGSIVDSGFASVAESCIVDSQSKADDLDLSDKTNCHNEHSDSS